jgi:class 3 adenylate cyclase
VPARVHITGELLVESEHGVVRGTDLPGRQGRLVLARLALTPHPVSREELADLVWAGQLPRSWERDLSTIVSKTKTALAGIGLDDPIASALGCYQLTLGSDALVDVVDALAAVDQAEMALRKDDLVTAHPAADVALNVARRPFLPGEEGQWVEARRADQRRLLVRSLDALIEVLVRKSSLPEALRYASEVVELEPFRESGYATLIRVQLAAGDRADALRTYERARALLAEELGIPPSEVLEAAYVQALHADAAPATGLAAPTAGRGLPVGTVTLMFTDLVGSTDLAEAVGAERFEVVRRAHFRLVRDAAATRRGHEVKNLGDGLMLAFTAAGDAVACAIDIHQAVERSNRGADVAVAVRIGVHVGEPVFEDGDYFGLPVAVASRICAAAEGGEILATDVVRVLAGAEGSTFGSSRQLALKGIADAVTAWSVLWAPAEERSLPLPDAACLSADPTFAFVGRDAEVRKLVALSAGSRVLLVAGEPGAGKTRTISEAIAIMHGQGANVLWGRCEQTGAAAYRPFTEAFRHLAVTAPDADLRRWVGSRAPDLARLVPDLGSRLGGVAPAVDTAGEADRARLFEAVADVLGAMGGDRPVVVVIDDAHWIDGPSALLLHHLATSPIPGCVVVIAYRPTELDRLHPFADLLGDLRRYGHVDRLLLPALKEPDVTKLLGGSADVLSPERAALARELVVLTDGNPFFVREVIRHLEETGHIDRTAGSWRFAGGLRALGIPEGVREVVGRRLSRFDDSLNAVLRTAAVIGREFELDVLATATDQTADAVLDMLEPAFAAELVVEVRGSIDRFMFSHALVQETLAAEVPASRRVRLHRRVAEAIESLRDARLDDYVDDLAHHYSEAAPTGTAPHAVAYARRAATAALGKLAYEIADAHLRRATELGDEAGLGARERCELLIDRAGVLRALAHRDHKAVSLAAADLARELDDDELFGRAALSAVEDWVLIGFASPRVDDDVVQVLEEAVARLGESVTGVRLESYLIAMLAVSGPTYDDLRGAELVERARRLHDPGTLVAAYMVGQWSPTMSPGEVDAIHDELRALGRTYGDPFALLGAEMSEVFHGACAGSRDRVEAAIATFEDVVDRMRLRSYRWQPRMWRMALSLLGGHYDDAERQFAALTEGLDGKVARYALGMAGITYFQICRDRGRVDEVLDATARLAPRIVDYGFTAAHVLGLVEMGRLSEARDVYDAARDRRTQRSASVHEPSNWHLRTLVDHRLGETDLAASDYANGLEFGHLHVVAGVFSCSFGSAQYGLGLRADQLERWDDADEHFRLARERNTAIGSPPWVAYAEHDHACSLARRGRARDKARAKKLATSALTTADQLGMARLAFEARETLAGL